MVDFQQIDHVHDQGVNHHSIVKIQTQIIITIIIITVTMVIVTTTIIIIIMETIIVNF